jgi:putative ABC transport system substrate-binding protein
MCIRAAIYATLCLLALNCAAPDAHASQLVSKWFSYSPDIERAWTATADERDPMVITVQPKGTAESAKRVLVLYPRPSSAYDIAISSILREFSAKGTQAEFRIVNFNLNDERGFQTIRLAETQRFDLIFAMGSESAAWLYKNYKGGKIPVVTVCSKDPVQLGQVKDYDTGSGTNIAYTSLNVPIEVQMAYVRELRPRLKNIAILVDKQNISAMQTQAEPVANLARKNGVNVIWAEVHDSKQARAELERMVPATVQQMKASDPNLDNSLFWLTGSTSVFKEIATINKLSDRVPVVSVVPEIVTEGGDTAALAIGVSFESNARLAAIYGQKILQGASPGALKVGIVSPPDISISFFKTHQIGMRVPFSFFESASSVYDYSGKAVRRVRDEIVPN